MFYLGLDLGQAQDYTALAIAERTQTETGVRYDVRHLQRFALGTSYPAIVTEVGRMMQAESLAGQCQLVLDFTGVGRPLGDLFKLAGLRPIAVNITSGQRVTHSDDAPDDYGVPKMVLVSTLQVLLQSQRIRFAEGLPEVPALIKEALGFQVKITDAANSIFGAWREGQHDDLLLSVMLAVWYAEHRPPRMRYRLTGRGCMAGGQRDGGERERHTASDVTTFVGPIFPWQQR